MSTSLDWFAAPFEAHGGTSGDGARRLLGQPSLDPLTVLVRETVQNSWDARDRDSGPPTYTLHLRTLEASERAVLNQEVFRDGIARSQDANLGLADSLTKNQLRVIEITDSGTSGLVGPTRADVAPEEDELTDFVDFVFNIGAVRDTPLGGGTYGFGKTIAFVVSRASTMVVSSCVAEGGALESRLIASGIGSQFSIDGKRYTGRQWWGRVEDGRVEPAKGRLARELASSLGLPTDRAGTSLLILDPDLRGRNDTEAMQFLASSLLWHAWPKMVPPPSGDDPAMRISALLNNAPFPLPDPLEEPRLAPFVDGLQRVRAAQAGAEIEAADPLPSQVKLLKCGRPKQDLGHLALVFATTGTRRSASPPKPEDAGEEAPPTDACPFGGHSHHTALLRQAELVVTYKEGPPSSVEGFQWGGVFRCLESVDDHFAMAEPPAHEGWDPEFARDSHGRTYVRVALREIKKGTRAFAAPTPDDTEGGSSISTARVGDLLSGMIPSLEGTGTTSRTRGASSGSGNGGTGRQDRIGIEVLNATLASGDNGREVRLELLIDKRDQPMRLQARVGVRIDTGMEVSPPEGSIPPDVGVLISPEGERIQPDGDGSFRVPIGPQATWVLTIDHHELAALDVMIEGFRCQSAEE